MEFILQNWWYLLLIVGFAYMMLKGGGCCGGHSHDDHDHSGHNHSKNNGDNGQYGSGRKNKQIEMVRDPQCGMYIDTFNSFKQKIDGVTYYFCSKSCGEKFVRSKLINKSA